MIIPTEIMAAVRDGDTQMVEHFLDEGGRVNAVDARGMTLLLGSVRCSKVELCRVLLERGADPNETLHPDYNEKKTDLSEWSDGRNFGMVNFKRMKREPSLLEFLRQSNQTYRPTTHQSTSTRPPPRLTHL